MMVYALGVQMSQGNLASAELIEARELKVILRAVGDTVRLQILHHLAQRDEMNVSELVAALRTSQPLLSWHLGVLRRLGLVSVRRQGRMVWYSLDRATLESVWARLDAWLSRDSEQRSMSEEEEHV
jgi:DNA-binding transcriptional ArsR family regulator